MQIFNNILLRIRSNQSLSVSMENNFSSNRVFLFLEEQEYFMSQMSWWQNQYPSNKSVQAYVIILQISNID